MAESTSRSNPLKHPPARPHQAAGAPLAGRVVLMPRVKDRDRIASALERAGAEVPRAAVTRTVPGDAVALEATARRIAAGEAAWLVLTSARTIDALAPYLLAEAGIGSATGNRGHHDDSGDSNTHVDAAPRRARATSPGQRELAAAISPVRVAVVGPATARAWAELAGAAPGTARRLLLPASALADPALGDGLRRAGWEVEQVAAYTTVTADTSELPPGLARTWAAGGVDAAVLTAPSTTRAVLELLGSPSPVTRLVAIGATTAAAAHELGLPVAATASSPTPEGVLRAVIDASQASTGSGSPSPEPP